MFATSTASFTIGRRLSAGSTPRCPKCHCITITSVYVVQDQPHREEERCDECGHLFAASGGAPTCADCGADGDRDQPIEAVLVCRRGQPARCADCDHHHIYADKLDPASPNYDEALAIRHDFPL